MIDQRGTAAVTAGAAVGACARWAIVESLPEPTGWPWAVFVVNVVGSFLLGVVLTITRHRTDDHTADPIRLAVGTGFCGALTTFATFAVDVAGLLRDGRSGLGLSYVLVSLVVGVAAFTAGRAAADSAPAAGEMSR